MKKVMALLVPLVLAAAVFSAVGCGDKDSGEKGPTVSTPGGKVTVSEDGDNGAVTVTGDGGSTKYKVDEGVPTEGELGAPIYPGAKYVQGSGGTVTTTAEGKTSTISGGEFTTTDDYGKVVEWYTGKLGAPFATDSESSIWMPSGSQGGYHASTVQVTAGDGVVTISIANLGL